MSAAANEIARLTQNVNGIAHSELTEIIAGMKDYAARLVALGNAAPGIFTQPQMASIEGARKSISQAVNSAEIALSATTPNQAEIRLLESRDRVAA